MNKNYSTGWISLYSIAKCINKTERLEVNKHKLNFDEFEGLYFSIEQDKCYRFKYKSNGEFNGDFFEINAYDIISVDPLQISDNNYNYFISEINEGDFIYIYDYNYKSMNCYFRIPDENVSEINEIRQKFEQNLS